MRKAAKDDPRVRYTRMILQDSLVALMKERPVAEIGIKEICGIAGVSRSTFYAYFKGVYDLLEQIEEETSAAVEAMIKQYAVSLRRGGRDKDIETMFETTLRFIADNSNSIQVLLSENGDLAFQKRFFQKIIEQAGKVLQTNPNIVQDGRVQESYTIFTVHGTIGLIQHWLKKNMDIPIPEMAKIILKLTAEARR